MNMTIGELSKRAQVKIPTIRYYETIGLMPTPPRSEGNRRYYDSAAIERLRFIRHARELGFEVDSIRDLLRLAEAPQCSCEEADDIARTHLAQVERRIEQLEALQAELRRMVAECGHGRVANCRVISILADHGQCLTQHSHDGPRHAHLNNSGWPE